VLVLGLILLILGFALKIAIVGLVVYLVISILSPETARRIRERWSGRHNP
jgi:hypothetical protein